jgi:hypothetical protein
MASYSLYRVQTPMAASRRARRLGSPASALLGATALQPAWETRGPASFN